MRIGIISGSHRKTSESERVGHYIEGILKTQKVDTYLFSLANNPLPLWDEGVWSDDPKWGTHWKPISDELKKCDGFVIISPEWAGMVPSGLKNFFLLCSPSDVGHKAALIVSVSSGIGGAYPVHELRTSSYKNNRICYIPEHVIIRDVPNMLKGDQAANDRDQGVRDRLNFALKVLGEYTKALGGVRESGVLDYKNFPFGM